MSWYEAKECGCSKDIGMSKARTAQYCEHKNLLVYVKQLGSKPLTTEKLTKALTRKPFKRTQPKRDWSDARRKVEDEMVCRVCGGNQDVQAAHVIGRSCDEPMEGKPNVLYVKPERIIPLCGWFSPMKCHALFDTHALDVLEFLTTSEQVQAVADAGSIESARRRTSPSSYKILSESPSGVVG